MQHIQGGDRNQTLLLPVAVGFVWGDPAADLKIDRWSFVLSEQIASKLREDGFEVAGVERAPSTVREVRFFYSEDKQLAEHLAANARSILEDAGFFPANVGIRDLTYWQRAKPPKATVELWLNID
jgi:hypothetical protein